MVFPSLLSLIRRGFRSRTSKLRRRNFSIAVEPLEVRTLLSAYTVSNLNDSGAGSLRQAIVSANAHPGADVINFSVGGTIQLSSALAAITSPVEIRGNSAPGFAGSPVVAIDFHGFAGLVFNPGSGGSAVRSLALDHASGAGIALNGTVSTEITGNFIGVGLNGATAAANGGNGIELRGSYYDTITSNVISGNGGNGIALYASGLNRIATNTIGANASGTAAVANAQNGILVTNSSILNTIGGAVSGGNDPTNGVYIRPTLGNLISGNQGDGVLISNGAVLNTLSGNFIGTDITGDAALGNSHDGVAIDHASLNSLVGCTQVQNPFVYYNVISGNGGNGLRINDSNVTTVQGNFFGLAANNQTALGNALNGVVVEGSSAVTIMGGRIPLGNVVAANGQNGIVVKDTASGFISFNTFCGLAAFKKYTNLGNGADGMLITSTGGNNVIRTNVITENGNDGVEISGSARDVHVGQNIIGLDTAGGMAMGNKNNGIEVDGNAHDIKIGAPKLTFSIIPYNVISGNVSNGVAVTGNAHDIIINYSDIGTNITGQTAIGNGGAGVFVGSGTHGVTVGSLDPNLHTLISGNAGDGIKLQGTSQNRVVDTRIGTDITGNTSLANGGSGISLTNSSHNTIGGYGSIGFSSLGGPANLIASNTSNGVLVSSGVNNAILGNSIHDNGSLGIKLTSGANHNQAAPTLTHLKTLPHVILVSGTLTSAVNSVYIVQFYANHQAGSSGEVFLGSQAVVTNGAGVANFTFASLRPPISPLFITATATDLQRNTSEFSAAIS